MIRFALAILLSMTSSSICLPVVSGDRTERRGHEAKIMRVIDPELSRKFWSDYNSGAGDPGAAI